MSSRRDDPIPSPSPSPSPRRSPRRSPSPILSPRSSPRRGRSRSPSQGRGNIGNVKHISEMTDDDIYGIKSLYKVIVDRKADYGDGYYKYKLDDGNVVDIEDVNLIRRDGEERVDALIRILEHDLGPLPIVGTSAHVGIYYVKNADSATDAKNMMNEYSKVYPRYAAKKDPFDIRQRIYKLKHLKHLKLKTNSGGRRHQRKSRRGKGNGRGKKSRSSKTLRRGRR